MFITRKAFEISQDEREKTIKQLIEGSYPGSYFFIMLLASSLIAGIGLAINNASIIIGSMLVAPFLAPILSVSLGIVLVDFQLIKRSLVILGKACALAIFTSTLVTLFLPMSEGYNEEIISRIAPSLPYLYVAIAAGIAATFALVKPNLSESIVGIAVSVSLLPPLATTGIGLRALDLSAATGSFQLFIVNLIGIIFAGVVIFSLMGFYPSRSTVEVALKKEEKLLKEEKESSP